MSANNRFVAKNGLDNNGFTITNVAQGTADDDVATRGYSRDASNIDTGTLNANRLALSGVSAGSYGTAQAIPILTIDNKGRVTSATSVPFTRVTNFTYTPGTTTFTIFTGDGTQFAATIPIAVNDQAEFGSFSFDAASTTFTYVSITTEEIQDVVGGMFTSNSELGLVTTYNDTTGKIDIDVDDFTISLSGDLAGSATITNLANATIVATIQPNSVDLGTDTVGDYIATASVSGVGLSGSATGEGSTFTVTSNATAANTPDTIVSRDVDGSFVAQDITADGNLSVTGTINRNPVITLAGDLSGSVTLTDLQSGTLAATIQPNSVALGTDTTGNYVGSVAAGEGIVVTGADGEGVTKTVAHDDTSNQASVDNANGTVIQDITLDGFGHITSIGSVNLDGRYYTEAESDARFANVTGDTFTGVTNFDSNGQGVGSGGRSGNLSAYSTSGNPATMSFHRVNAYAINMGLDTDNVFRLGGWSNGTNVHRWQAATNYFMVQSVLCTNNTTARNIAHATGSYGTFQCNGGGNGAWEGWSIDGRAVFMHSDNSNVTGIYNDVENQWLMYGNHGSHTRICFAGSEKLRTESGGITVLGTITETSDRRLKKDIKPIEGALDKVLKLQGVTYKYKNGDDLTNIGFIAQDVQDNIPEVVREVANSANELHVDGVVPKDMETYLTLSYADLTAMLAEAIKEQQQQINKLQEQLNKPSLFKRFIGLFKK